MLGEILGAGEQGLGHARIGRRIALTPHRAGEHSTGDDVACASNEEFWGGTDQPADTEGPARGIGARKRTQHGSRIERTLDGCEDIPGQHHLVQFASINASDSFINCLLPLAR
jgi:hypothetical protein